MQGSLLSADIPQQVVQFPGGAGNELRRCLVCGQFPALAHSLKRWVVLTLDDVVEDVGIEFPGRRRQFRILPTPGHQGVEGLVDIPGQGREGAQFFPGGPLDGVQRLVSAAQVGIDAVLQLGGAQHPVCDGRLLLRGAFGYPGGAQNILYGDICFSHGTAPLIPNG